MDEKELGQGQLGRLGLDTATGGRRPRNGMREFYSLLEEMAITHDKKSHDYASNDNPSGNYHFAGQIAKMFDDPADAGFAGRIAEKLYRIANLSKAGKTPLNESVEDTEIDIVTITALWMADRRRRRNQNIKQGETRAEFAQRQRIEVNSRPYIRTEPPNQ
jgi:hypothetical protein